MTSFEGRVVLVTGSSSGIGEACARAFAAAGARVVVNSSSSVDAGERLAADLPEATYVRADVGDEAQVRHLVATAAERWGRLDVVVNNAGWTRVIPFADLDAVTSDVRDRVLRTNLLGTWHVTRLAAPHLREAPGGGAVVNITSVAGHRAVGSSIAYATSKAAIEHLTRLLAVALAPTVRVNAVAPGLIETPWTAGWGPVKDALRERTPLRRLGQPDDIAEACVAVAGSTFLTGEVVTVDGGMQLA